MTLNIDVGLVRRIADVARRAGAEIMRVYRTDFDVAKKSDASPVTEADEAAEALILRAIREGITDRFPIVSEERFERGDAPDVANTPFWLVDPLDGTKEFVNRNGDFTVNIALIESGRPALGIVMAPAHDIVWAGSKAGAWRQVGKEQPQPIACRRPPNDGLTALVSRSHATPETEAYLKDFRIKQRTSAGSSLKFCRVAEGAADLYPRLGRTMEWDTAAGHAVLLFAGGVVETLDHRPLSYGKPGHENPHFVAAGPGVLAPVG